MADAKTEFSAALIGFAIKQKAGSRQRLNQFREYHTTNHQAWMGLFSQLANMAAQTGLRIAVTGGEFLEYSNNPRRPTFLSMG